MMADHNEESEVLRYEKNSWMAYELRDNEAEAVAEANKMIEFNRWDGAERCSREFAIQMILDDLQ